MRNFLRELVGVAVIGVILYAIFRPGEVTNPDLCETKSEALTSVYARFTEGGLLSFRGSDEFGSTFDVSERAWAGLTQDQKVTVALSAFCRVADKGRGQVFFSGVHDGQIKGSMKDGNYFN